MPIDERNKYPIVNVSWYDAEKYTEWLSEQTGRHYRLPSEAEWEYAARGTGQLRFLYWWGDEITPELANYGNPDTEPLPAGEGLANPYGLYDIHGNVAEWVADSYCRSYGIKKNGSDGAAVVLDEKEEARSVVRGGSCTSPARDLRCSSRPYRTKSERSPEIGFRVARDI